MAQVRIEDGRVIHYDGYVTATGVWNVVNVVRFTELIFLRYLLHGSLAF